MQAEHRPIGQPPTVVGKELSNLDGNLRDRGNRCGQNAQPPAGRLDEPRDGRHVGIPCPDSIAATFG